MLSCSENTVRFLYYLFKFDFEGDIMLIRGLNDAYTFFLYAFKI